MIRLMYLKLTCHACQSLTCEREGESEREREKERKRDYLCCRVVWVENYVWHVLLSSWCGWWSWLDMTFGGKWVLCVGVTGVGWDVLCTMWVVLAGVVVVFWGGYGRMFKVKKISIEYSYSYIKMGPACQKKKGFVLYFLLTYSVTYISKHSLFFSWSFFFLFFFLFAPPPSPPPKKRFHSFLLHTYTGHNYQENGRDFKPNNSQISLLLFNHPFLSSTDHKPQTTNHKSQTTNHRPQTTFFLSSNYEDFFLF